MENLSLFITDENQYFLPNGEINWDCPCHGEMIYGPCAMEYRDFLTNCVFPKEDATKETCVEKHKEFEKCINKYPAVYPELQLETRIQEAEAVHSAGDLKDSGNSRKDTSIESPSPDDN